MLNRSIDHTDVFIIFLSQLIEREREREREREVLVLVSESL